MSAALNTRGDSSQSGMTLQDLSLGSLGPFASPKLRVPSTSSTATTAVSSVAVGTPSPPSAASLGSGTGSRRKTMETVAGKKHLAFTDEELEEGTEDILDTPGRDRVRLRERDDRTGGDAGGTPVPNRAPSKRKSGSGGARGSNLTLRDQEKHIDALKKENFNIKLKVHFLEERLAQLAPDQIDTALKQNINLKIEVQQFEIEMKKYKKLVLKLERELERVQRGRGREKELEEKLEQLELELRDVRRRRGFGDGSDDEEIRQKNAELEERCEQLEGELREVTSMLEDNAEVVERLEEELELQRKNGHGESSLNASGKQARLELEARIEELEAENEDLRVKMDEQAELFTEREDEREELFDEIQSLKLTVEDLTRKREAEILERSESRAQILEEREEREAIEDDLNSLRDKLAASAIEMSQKDDEIEMKNRELDELVADHERNLEATDEAWRGEMESAKKEITELNELLIERESECKELLRRNEELLNQTEVALEHMDQQMEEKDTEIESANREIQTLGQRVYDLEDELDQLKEENARLREDEAVERDRLEALVMALKEKVAQYKADLQETTNLYEQCSQDILAHRARQEELASHVEDLVQEVRRERELREKTENELDVQTSKHESALRHERRTLDAKESALQSALSDLARTQTLLSQREADLADVQAALKSVEAESRKLGESASTDRFSLQLEADRLRRDVERLEEELSRARTELTAKEAKMREREDVLDKMHAESRDLATQLAAQTQARLNASEKLDTVQGSLRVVESEAASYKQRVSDLEQRLSKDQRSLLNTENQYRDQLTERNTLLLTIYQYMDKILGVDKTPKKGETKPFTNFSVFHDNLISRLKALSQIQLEFDKKCKDAESRYGEKFSDLKKQLDFRWKQIDKFETSLKNLAETKQGWKRKFSAKEGELEALKTTNTELTAQLSSLKRPAQAESLEIKALQARAANAERRLTNAQNQLLASEEKLATMNQKTTVADNKWEARVKEYETRIKGAEERVKRERQGAKERVSELENSIKLLQKQLELAGKRSQQLNDVLDANQQPRPSSSKS